MGSCDQLRHGHLSSNVLAISACCPAVHMYPDNQRRVCCTGEIVPQALCTRFGLAIGAYSAWFVQLLIYACWIIAWPISKVLDWLLGDQHSVSSSPLFKAPHVTVPKNPPSICPASACAPQCSQVILELTQVAGALQQGLQPVLLFMCGQSMPI